MKKLLITITLSVISVSAFAQGTIVFNNDANTLVTTNNGSVSGPATNARVILLYSTAAVAPEAPHFMNGFNISGWTQTTPTTADPVGMPLPGGRFAGGTQIADGAVGGSSPWVVVIGWTGPSSTLDEALFQFFNGAIFMNASGVWAQPTGDSANALPPVLMLLGPTAFNGMVLGVPEPSTFALGILGAGSLMFLSRKKLK